MKPKLSIFIFIFSYLQSVANTRRNTRKTEKPHGTRQCRQKQQITSIEKPKCHFGFSTPAFTDQQAQSIVLQRSSSYSSNSIGVWRRMDAANTRVGTKSPAPKHLTGRPGEFFRAGVLRGRGGEKVQGLSVLDRTVTSFRSGANYGRGGINGVTAGKMAGGCLIDPMGGVYENQ